MRNSKAKGFTLVELIVVIAIIGILAAVLIPSMLAYVRNARISNANSNARTINSAAASVLTNLGIDNASIGTGTVQSTAWFGATGFTDPTNAVKFPAGGSITRDFTDYLGANYNAGGIVFYDPLNYAPIVCFYAGRAAEMGQVTVGATGGVTAGSTGTVNGIKIFATLDEQTKQIKADNLVIGQHVNS